MVWNEVVPLPVLLQNIIYYIKTLLALFFFLFTGLWNEVAAKLRSFLGRAQIQ